MSYIITQFTITRKGARIIFVLLALAVLHNYLVGAA